MQTVEYQYKGHVIRLEEQRDPGGSARNMWIWAVLDRQRDNYLSWLRPLGAATTKQAANKAARRSAKRLSRKRDE